MVSVIIPTYNRVNYICEAIDSVLSQTFQDFEIIVIDDGSTDNTKELLKKYEGRIRYIYQENHGLSAARNRGIKEAAGEYVAFLDSDDVWYPDKLLQQVSFLNNNRKVGLVASLMNVIDADGNSINQIKPKQYPGNCFENALIKSSPVPSTFVIRRECFVDVGMFDENLRMLEDYDLFVKISERYGIETLNTVLGNYRIHSSNITKDEDTLYYQQIIVAKKWLSHCHTRRTQDNLVGRIKKYSLLLSKQNFKKRKILLALNNLSIFIFYNIRYPFLTHEK